MFILVSVYQVGRYYYDYRMAGGIKGHSIKFNKAILAVTGAGKAASKNLMLEKNELTSALLQDPELGNRRTTLALTNGEPVDEAMDPRLLDVAPPARR